MGKYLEEKKEEKEEARLSRELTAFTGLQQPPSRGSWLRRGAGASRLGADEAAGGRCLFLST